MNCGDTPRGQSAAKPAVTGGKVQRLSRKGVGAKQMSSEAPGKTKECSHCGLAKPRSDFNKLKNGVFGLSPRCRRCQKAYKRQHIFGLTVQEFEYILQDQEHACGICRTEFDSMDTKFVHVDHCHESGKVRGILCHGCNTALGLFNDSKQSLLDAYNWLDKHSSS